MLKPVNFRADEVTLALLEELTISSENQKKAEIIRNAIYHFAILELGQVQVNEIVAGTIALQKNNLL